VNASQFRGDREGLEHVRRDDLVQRSPELPVRELDAIQGFELSPVVRLERGAIADVGSMVVLEIPKLLDKGLFKIAFGRDHRHDGDTLVLGAAERIRSPGAKRGRGPRRCPDSP